MVSIGPVRWRLSPLGALFVWQWRFRMTDNGKVLLISVLIATSIGAGSLATLAYHLLCGLCALTIVAYAAGRRMRPRLRVENLLPRKAVAGMEVAGAIRLTNASTRPAHDVCAGVFGLPAGLQRVSEEAVLGALAPGESETFPVILRPLRRGLYPLPRACAYSTFPFHLMRTEGGIPKWTGPEQDGALLVYPHFHPVAAIDVPTNARYQPGGIMLSSSVGESMEYIGNREYHPGDSPRQLDHRSWARLARPVVKEYQEEYYCRVGLVLDTFVPGRRLPPPEGFPEVEAAISLAASAADALARGEYIIDLFAAGPEINVYRAGRHTAHFEHVLEILASLDVCRDDPFGKVAPALAEELGSISSVICVLLDWDDSRRQLVRAAREAGCATKILLVRDSPPSTPLFAEGPTESVRQISPRAIRGGGIETL